MLNTRLAVEAVNLRKAFGATVALEDVSFAIEGGTVHALLGENGAGKSTVVKTLSGLLQPDSGDIRVFGEKQTIANPRTAHRLGIQAAFQEMTQIRDLSVMQNMLLPYEPVTAWGALRGREGERRVIAHLDALGLGWIDPRAEVRGLDLAVRQKLEIARAILRDPKVLLLDEPTSTLSGRDIDWLGEIIARAKAQGTAVIFISHRMPEVNAFCEYLTVLRNGRNIGTGRVNDFSEEEVIRMIIGRSLAATFPVREKSIRSTQPPRLAACAVSTAGRLKDASFALAPGEVLGIAGLQGMGQLELFLSCFGATPIASGHIEVNGRPITLACPQDAIDARIGISLVPEDRKTEALFLKLDGRRNVSLPTIDRYTRWGLIDREAETAAVSHALEAVQVHARALYMPAKSFSGGNQQKIAIAKWLMTGSRTLMLYDPTRGVDVGTKHEIYVLIHDHVRSGGSVLLFSTEIPELVNLCHRVLVMYGGQIVQELGEDELEEEAIIRAALGDARPKVAAERSVQ